MKRKGPFDAKWHHHEIRLWLETKGMRKSQLDRRLAEARKELGEELHLGNVASPAFWLESASFWWTNMFLDQVYIRSVAEAAESGSRMLDYAFWNLRIGVAVSDTPGGFRGLGNHELYPYSLLLLTFRRWDQAMWLGGRLHGGNEENARRAPDNKESGIQPWMDTPFGGFVLRLYLVFSGRLAPDAPPPEGLPDCGPYAGLFTHWHESGAF